MKFVKYDGKVLLDTESEQLLCLYQANFVALPLRNVTFLSDSITVAARSKASVYGRSLAVITGWNPAGRMEICLSLSVVCYQVELSASD